jgi:ABC-type Na+ transport system ATPase subunit NatA
MTKTQGNFRLRAVEGEFTDSQIIVMLGENGTGKTTFIRMLVYLLILYISLSNCIIHHTYLFTISFYSGWFIET